MAVEQVAVTQTPAKYPGLTQGEVPFNTFQTLRLLWDRIYSLQDRLAAAEATITRLIAAANTTETATQTAQTTADEAVAVSQES